MSALAELTPAKRKRIAKDSEKLFGNLFVFDMTDAKVLKKLLKEVLKEISQLRYHMEHPLATDPKCKICGNK